MKYTGNLFRVLLTLVATLSLLSPSPAQSTYVSGVPSLSAYSPALPAGSPADDQSAMITLHAQVNEVHVLFIATNKHGKFVRDLTQSDFSILDDHKPPQAIVNFHRESDLPLHLGLLIDVSG